jgi:hypothetical protein
MAVTSQRVSVGATATALNTVGTAGMTLTIRNGATAIELGPSTSHPVRGYSMAGFQHGHRRARRRGRAVRHHRVGLV